MPNMEGPPLVSERSPPLLAERFFERSEAPALSSGRFLSNARHGSFATGSSQSQVRPCPLCPESGSKFTALAAPRWALPVDGAILSVTQAPKPEPRIPRYELSDYEWTAIKPAAIDVIARPSTDPCVGTD